MPRQRLFDLLSTGPTLRVVTAPSGFGKTTLLRSWVDLPRDAERALVWVALSAGVASRREFWQLVAASAWRTGDVDRATYERLTRDLDVGDDVVEAAARFFAECGPTLLVIDAYEHLRELTEHIDSDLLRLVARVAGLELVVTTRAPTSLAQDAHVMRGVVRVVDESDLRFTVDEVADLLELHAPHTVDVADRIAADTRGYPLGVRAVAYGCGRSGRLPTIGTNGWQRLVTDDLRSQLADPVLADFVLATCVPPYFDRQLACRLTGADDVDKALTELAWGGFGRWIPYAHGRPAFQYVDAVREVFLHQLRSEQSERYEHAAAIAAAALHRDTDHGPALALAIEARQFELASTICRRLMMTNADIYTTDLFERHLRRVPRAALVRHPVLAFARAMAYTTNPATRGSAAEYFRIAADHALDDVARLAPAEVFHRHVGREVSLRYLGRTREAAAAADAGLACFDALSAADRDGLGEFPALALGILAYSLFQDGDVDRAAVVVDRAAAAAVTPWWRNYALSLIAGIHALAGRRPAAAAALATMEREAWDAGGARRLPQVLGVTGRAALLLDEFDCSGALRAYDEAEWLLEVAESWPFITWVMMHARLGLGEAGTEARRVEAALAATPAQPGLGPNLATAALLNALAILWLADGRPAKARRVLRRGTACPGQLAPASLLNQIVADDPAGAMRNVPGLLAEPGHTIRSAAAVDTLGAVAALRIGNDRAALELLKSAAVRHRTFGVRAHLMYVPGADLDALRGLATSVADASCVAYLGGPVVTPVLTPIGLARSAPVQLTPREIEVLGVWARHRTRADVARALFVSPNTVRSQLRSSYRKLGVTTKDAAIQRAIELDLLRPDGG